jgi:hypothetical protein
MNSVLDISTYIQELLWDYECVIIPGFGGILATYRPAEMVLAEHIIYPPSKSLSFNDYLTTSDGLLVNHIYRREQVSYSEASDQVEAWVRKTQNLLNNNEEIYLPRIGRFYRDVEKKLRFEPDTSASYLPSAYGLRQVIAAPILRSISADTIEVMEPHRASYTLPKPNRKWAMAAVVVLFLALGSVIDLMYQGVNVRPLDLNAASVLGFLENFDKHPEPGIELKTSISKDLPALNTEPKVSVVRPAAPVSAVDTGMEPMDSAPATASESSAGAVNSTGKKYYIIIGAFRRHDHLTNALAYLKDKHPGEEVYEDTSLENKRIGFYAGDNYQLACAKLNEARKDQQDFWLLVKK